MARAFFTRVTEPARIRIREPGDDVGMFLDRRESAYLYTRYLACITWDG